MPSDGDLAARVAGQLGSAPKYRRIAPETRERIAAWAVARASSEAEAVKLAKRKLHQTFAAFLDPGQLRRLTAAVETFEDFQSPGAVRDFCRTILRHHASTAERLAILDQVYAPLFAGIEPVRTVLDIACGLHPFAVPWLPIERDSSYLGYDIDEGMVALGARFLAKLGQPGVLECRDVLVRLPTEAVDVALALKTVTTLNQQEGEGALRVLRAIRARRLVVSFPVRSLGGRERGMRAHYTELGESVGRALGEKPRVVSFPSELFLLFGQ